MVERYIKTHRSRDVSRSVLVVSKFIYNYLVNKKKKARFNDVYIYIKELISITERDFMYAINFMYILGILKYNKEKDLLNI